MNHELPSSANALDAARRNKDLFRRLSFAAAISGLILFLVLSAALADLRWYLEKSIRCSVFGALVLVVAAALIARMRSLARRSTLKEVALDIEAAQPQIGCSASTLSEYLEKERSAGNNYEEAFVTALGDKTAKQLRGVALPYGRRFFKFGAWFGAAVFALILFLALASAPVTALSRVLAPWSDIAYAKLKVQPGNVETAVGADQEVNCQISGTKPRNAKLLWHKAGESNWTAVAVSAGTNGNYAHTFRALDGDVQYRFAANDAVSEEFLIKTYVPPKITAVTVKVQPPEYTKQATSTEHEPDLTVLRGSKLTYEVSVAGQIVTADWNATNGVALDLHQSGAVWTNTIQVTNNLCYSIGLTDKFGHKGGNDKPFHITTLADEPPKVTVVEPGNDIRADATNRIPIKIEATDDFGVEEVKLVFHKLSSSEQTIPCPIASTNRLDVTVATELDLAPLQLNEFDVVAYHAEARDNNTFDGPGIGKSPVYFIEITSRERPLSQCQGGSSQQVNLLGMEKQILSATSRTDAGDSARMQDLATMQRQAHSYGDIFRKSPLFDAAPPEALLHFDYALAHMDGASDALAKAQKSDAAGEEEKALVELYQTAKLLPEFESQCRGGNCKGLKVLLQAIEKEKKKTQKTGAEELAQVLRELRNVKKEQQNLQQSYSQCNSSCTSPGSKEGAPKPGEAMAKKGDYEQKPGQKPGEKRQESKPGQNQQTAQAKPGEKPGSNPSPGQLAGQQEKLVQRTASTEQRLTQLAGKDTRISHSLNSGLQRAESQMQQAQKNISQGQAKDAGAAAGTSVMELGNVIGALELVYKHTTSPADLSNEDVPKQFEAAVADYFRRLSYEGEEAKP